MRRFFAFGCSYTRYHYPTWADIIGAGFDEFYNYGQAGVGNRYIFSAVAEANIVHKFTSNDLIMIEWSAVEREEEFFDSRWNTQLHRGKKQREGYTNENKLLETLTYIIIVKALLTAMGIEHRFFPMIDFADADCQFPDMLNFYKKAVESLMPGFVNSIEAVRPVRISNRIIHDGHHLPWEHYDYVQRYLPEYLPAISNLREEMKSVYEKTIDIALNDSDQEIALSNAMWPVKIPIGTIKPVLFTSSKTFPTPFTK